MAIDYSIYGRYADFTIRGQLFAYICPGQALLIADPAGGNPTLWNPLGSLKLFVPVRLVMSFLSGTTTIGAVVLARTLLAGSGISATAPIVTFTDVAGKCTRRGAGNVSTMRWGPTTNTFTAAQTVVSATSLNFGTADPTNGGHRHTYDFDGTIGIDPGTALSICYSVATATSLFHLTLFGLEIPLSDLN